MPPKTVLSLGEGKSVVHIHETADYKYYIVHDSASNEVYFIDSADTGQALSPLYAPGANVAIHDYQSIGNTFIILASDGMHYFLWKGAEERYLYLGSHLPELPISFGLQGEMVRTDEFEISFEEIPEADIFNEFSDDNKARITEQVLAKVNKFIAENSTEKGKFIYPFLVRYAYRLYDETLAMHSAPVLMVCSSDLAPQVFYTHITGKGSYTNAKLQVAGMLHKLDYAVAGQQYIDGLNNWRDIVYSVDIFVSAPIYTYDQNGECTKFVEVDKSDCYTVCLHTNQAVSESILPLRYQKKAFSYLYATTFNPGTMTYPAGRLLIPQRSAEAVKEDIRSCAQFYLLQSIKVESLAATRTVINVAEDYLQSLVNREVMSDDLDSHDTLLPQYAYVYNKRVNIANLQKKLFDGFNPAALFTHTNGYIFDYTDAAVDLFDTKCTIGVYYYVKEDGRDIVVAGGTAQFGQNTPLLFLYYPNRNAYKAVVAVVVNEQITYYEVALEKHDFLHGAFYFGGWQGLEEIGGPVAGSPNGELSSEAEKVVDISETIYYSEVNNPFYFPTANRTEAGIGRVMAIMSATKALSEGQFGQFPLYAFTSEGVWALEVTGDGTYSASQPVSRDICLSADSIVQLDDTVVFASSRGLMQLSGSTTQCISNALKSESTFTIAGLPKHASLLDVYNKRASPSEQLELADIDIMPFAEFLKQCRMVYDYPNQRIVCYNPAARYAYVFSLKSQLWGMMRSDFASNVNSYPEALAMTVDGRLVDFSQTDAKAVTALVATRPFKLGLPDVLKTITTIIQRGYFVSSHVVQVLYGSNDLFHWHVVWSSVDKYLRGFRGTPYKAYRLAMVARLDKEESIFGFTVESKNRMLDQPR